MADPSSPVAGSGDARPGPSTWIVAWGSLGRGGFVVERVVAFDADEALALAAERQPDLERPRVALLISGSGTGR